MAYRVELPVFCGPLDLLLHLVRQQEVDIHEVRISSILDQYLDQLGVLRELDLGDLGDFLVLASTLMEIKSREMLPAGDEVEVDEVLDPRDDLIRQLLDYKRYRDLSRRLDRLARRRSRMLPAHLSIPVDLEEEPEAEPEFDLGGVEIWSLTAAFAKLLQATGQEKTLDISVDKRDVRFWAGHVLERTRGRKEVPFEELFAPSADPGGAIRTPTRGILIGIFIACLEMMKQGVLRAHQPQDNAFGEIFVVYTGPEDIQADQILAGGRRIDREDDETTEADAAGIDAEVDGAEAVGGLVSDGVAAAAAAVAGERAADPRPQPRDGGSTAAEAD